MKRVSYLALTLGILVACSQPDEDRAAPAAQSAVPAPGASEHKPSEQTLDLSKDVIDGALNDVLPEGSEALEALETPEDVLPDLFDAAKEDAKKVKVSGSVLTKEEAESLRDSIDGVEVQLEVKTP